MSKPKKRRRPAKGQTNYHTYSNGATLTTVITTINGKGGRARLKRRTRPKVK